MLRVFSITMAALLLSNAVLADDLATSRSDAAFAAQPGTVMIQQFSPAMDLCEYEHALSSPGWVIKMPVHIRGVTDEQNMARCLGGRWLPAASVRLDGDGQR